METPSILILILGMAAVTAPARVVPLAFLTAKELPKSLKIYLSYVPVAVISAMLAPQLFLSGGRIDLSFRNLYLWVSISAFAVAWKTRSFSWTVLAGIVVMAMECGRKTGVEGA